MQANLKNISHVHPGVNYNKSIKKLNFNDKLCHYSYTLIANYQNREDTIFNKHGLRLVKVLN